ncbi:MAG: response regulator [Gammaproteobacteria bacterium]|nr:response regulator [Gammaproteobacteria bacterium]MCP5195365.1 response regulator [Gammaproteobacteria bacterium]
MAKILVIEDDTQFCQMLAQMLIQAGHEVETALNGVLGLERFRQSIPDLVITDIMMPEKDGIDVIVDIKRQNAEVRIIAISGGRRAITPQFNLDSAALIGAVQVLAKPFNREQLLAAIAAALE